MKNRKNVLLLFSKLPEAELVKTRLTTLKDGIFDPEEASYLYHCMLFDVAEICMAAFDALESEDGARQHSNANTGAIRDEYELVISTAPAKNVSRMEKLFSEAGEWPRPITFIADSGTSFDEHYNDAFSQCWNAGADTILSMGADMPALTVRDVVYGFRALQALEGEEIPGIVIAPDQEMGVSVIGWTRETEFDHTGVFYNEQGITVLPAYIRKAREAGLAAKYLPPVPDVDTMADFFHNVTLVEALNFCSKTDRITPPWRTWEAMQYLGWDEVRVAPNELRDPRDHIDSIDS